MPAEQAPTYNQISAYTSTFGQTTAFTEPEGANKAPETTRLAAKQTPTYNHTSASIEHEKINGALETTWVPDSQASTSGVPDNTFKDTSVPDNTSASAVNLTPSELFLLDQKPHLRRKSKISSKHETAIDFSLPNAGTVT